MHNHPRFDTLVGGTPCRLSLMRAYRDRWNADPGHIKRDTLLNGGLAGCLQARSHGIGQLLTDNHGLSVSIPFAAEEHSDYVSAPVKLVDGWRDRGNADSILNLRYSAWYADEDGDETYTPHVWQIPARNGKSQFVAGYTEGEGPSRENVSGYCVLVLDGGKLALYDTQEEAAREADHLAERNAERQREYDVRWHEAQEHDEARNDARQVLSAARGEAAAIIEAWREQQSIGALGTMVCTRLRLDFDKARDRMHAAMKDIARAADAIDSLGMAGEF